MLRLAMELLQLVYFCSAAETENFAKAAQLHNVPPASISHSVKRLETELGVSLFDRSPNGVRLNKLGKALYQGTKASLAILEDARKEVREETMGVSIKLLVDSGRNIVNKAMSLFRQSHPRSPLPWAMTGRMNGINTISSSRTTFPTGSITKVWD